MRYLADACALIVFLSDPDSDQTMPGGARVMRSSDVFILPITVWEITRKVASGRLPPVWGRWPCLRDLLRAQNFIPHPLSWDAAEEANGLPPHRKDPMDRMLIGTALRADLTVITSDVIFAAYGVKTIW